IVTAEPEDIGSVWRHRAGARDDVGHGEIVGAIESQRPVVNDEGGDGNAAAGIVVADLEGAGADGNAAAKVVDAAVVKNQSAGALLQETTGAADFGTAIDRVS